MSSNATDTDDTLKDRLRDRLDFLSADADDDDDGTEQEANSDTTNDDNGTTEQEGDMGGEDDEENEDDEDDDTEQEMDSGDAVEILVGSTEMDREEAMALTEALAAGASDDDGGETGDAEGELSSEAETENDVEEIADQAADAAADVVEQELDDLREQVVFTDEIEEKLDQFADTMAEETETTVEQALTGSTPAPDSTGSTDIDKSDLFSDGGSDDGGD